MFEKLFRKKEVKTSESNWPFSSPENEVTITVKQIVDKTLPILLVSHEEEDGSWQFLTGGDFNMADGMMVSLKTITTIDPTILNLADLPEGWQATRQDIKSSWIKTKS